MPEETMTDKPRVVVCAALRALLESDAPIITGPRHYDQTMFYQMFCSPDWRWIDIEMEQGFIDQFGVFMTREEAYKVAEEAGQIKYRCGGDTKELFSENLY